VSGARDGDEREAERDGEREAAPEVTIDAIGLRCPLPIIRLAVAARNAPAGTVIRVLSTDPAAEPDIAAWCRMREQELVDQTWLDGRVTLVSRVRILRTG
jgi:tRNA 2-thiouridine synthesizing protein A